MAALSTANCGGPPDLDVVVGRVALTLEPPPREPVAISEW